ncbi:MAG: sulfite oxidase-like oxidoreductase [Bacteroidota bacterium]
MEEPHITRGFKGKRRNTKGKALPPGQHEAHDFPVLSAGPTPKIPLTKWELVVDGLVSTPYTLSWEAFQALPARGFTVDIHCVTTWSKFDTQWRGISLQTLIDKAGIQAEAKFVMAHCYGGYTTNLPLEDLLDDKAFIGYEYGGFPLTPEHGGPARLVVPHLYFWKSAKWVQRLEFMAEDKAGFWESIGYHHYGDPWKEQRYEDD